MRCSRASILFQLGCFIALIVLPYHAISQAQLTVTLLEKESRKPVELATLVLSPGTKPVAGAKTIKLTDSAGKAVFSAPKDSFRLGISHTAYNDTAVLVSNPGESDLLFLLTKKTVTTIGDVTVTGYRKSYQELAGGYQYQVDKKTALVSRDASELLKHLPGINPARDGSLTLMGDKVTFWVDGKPLNMSPEELSSYFKTLKPDDIKSIKVYTTPPSIFDASTPSVIEIITNKNFANGMQYNLEGYAATHDKYYASTNMKWTNKIYTGSLRLLFDHSNSRFSESIRQKNDLLPDSLYYYNNETKIQDRVVNSFSATSNNDFVLSKNSYLGVTLRYNQYDYTPSDLSSTTQLFDRSGKPASTDYFKRTNSASSKIGYGGISYRSTLNKKGTLLLVDATIWNRNSTVGFDEITAKYTNNHVFSSYENIRNNESKNRIRIYTASFSLQHDLSKTTRLRFGAKETAIDHHGDYREMRSDDNISFSPDTINSYGLAYKENVLATFASLSGEIKKFQYTAGLRWEGTTTSITTSRLSKTTENVNTYSNLLPSVSISYKLSKTLSGGLGYSRSIIRIQFAQLNPLDLRRNSFTSYQGNPYLKPILQDAINFSLNKTLPKNRLLNLMVRYSNSRNSFLPILFADSNHTGQYIERYMTYKGNSSVFGNLFYRGDLSKKISLNANIRAFNTWIHLDSLFGYPDPAARWAYGGNLGIIVSFWKNAAMEIKANYQSKQVLVQGYGYEAFYMSLSFSKSFLKNALSVSLDISDIFDTNNNTTSSGYPGFSVNTYSKDETRVAGLTIGYRFGKERKNNIKTYSIQEEKRFSN
jgi:hypothetical protein